MIWNPYLQVIREHALHFVKHLIAKIGDESHEGVQILIQHLAMKAANEKTAFRQNVAGAIIILMLGLPRNYFSTIARWFFRLAHSDGQGKRMFALEIIGKLLMENERERERAQESFHGDHDYGNIVNVPEKPPETLIEEHNEEVENSDYVFASHKFMFGMIFSKSKDTLATVRYVFFGFRVHP